MLRSIKQIYGDKLAAKDGEIGQVKDFYFDDRDWAVRYVVVDTGTWLPGRKVLISPFALGRLDQASKILHVNLTKSQIENCPSVESHKPVSRQYEEEYHDYYGWPYYWQGDSLWGMSGFPVLELPSVVRREVKPQLKVGDIHLRSAQAVNGYSIKSSEATTGTVCDFMIDAESWKIGQLVIRTGHRLSGNEVLVSTDDVGAISYDDSSIIFKLNVETAATSSAPEPAPFGTTK